MNTVPEAYFLFYGCKEVVEGTSPQARRHDIQHNDAQHNDIQHNDTQHNNIQLNDTQHKGLICDTQHE